MSGATDIRPPFCDYSFYSKTGISPQMSRRAERKVALDKSLL